jgi:hypothetical protein
MKFESKEIELKCHGIDNEISTAKALCLGDFGYHETPIDMRSGKVHCRLKGMPCMKSAKIEYTVTHIPSGLYANCHLSVTAAKKLVIALKDFSGILDGWNGKGVANDKWLKNVKDTMNTLL